MKKDSIIMSGKDVRVYRLALDCISGRTKVLDFAMAINKSERQAYRILEKVKAMDYLGVLHGNTGNVPFNKTPVALEIQIINLYKGKYCGFNITHFREKLATDEEIIIGKTALEKMVKRHGIVKFPRRSRAKVHKPRPRHAQEGSLIQYDGSKHIWFGDEWCVLLAAIDDATSKIISARFVEGETSMNGLAVIRNVIEENGIPHAFYMDQSGLYGKLDRETFSQIGRALKTVHCRLLIASSPEAKGRIERAFRTLQDRLVAELKLRGIWNMEDANEYLKEYLPVHNRKFAEEAASLEKAYLPNVFGDLDLIFCRKEVRKVCNGNVFSYEGRHWLITENFNYDHRQLNINTHLDGSRSFDIMGKVVRVEQISRKRFLKTGT